jgi:hypothetical protein
MPGTISLVGHGGFRSELLAQYFFSSFGTVVSTPNPMDHGIDLHCTLMEAVGQRAWTRAPYTVQVKSNMDPWVFEGMESVRWLIHHPLPLYLAVIDKSAARLRVYHTSARFYTWSLGQLPESLTLRPTTDEIGHSTQWQGSFEFSLSAPILDVLVAQLVDDEFMKQAHAALEMWINVDVANLTWIRAGLLMCRMPTGYRPNHTRFEAWIQQGLTKPSNDLLAAGITHLAAALDCIGGQLYNRQDIKGAAKAGLMYRHLQKKFPALFGATDPKGGLAFAITELKMRMKDVGENHYFAGIDELQRIFEAAVPSDPGDR